MDQSTGASGRKTVQQVNPRHHSRYASTEELHVREALRWAWHMEIRVYAIDSRRSIPAQRVEFHKLELMEAPVIPAVKLVVSSRYAP